MCFSTAQDASDGMRGQVAGDEIGRREDVAVQKDQELPRSHRRARVACARAPTTLLVPHDSKVGTSPQLCEHVRCSVGRCIVDDNHLEDSHIRALAQSLRAMR